MGWHAVRRFLFPRHINPGFSQWPVHTTTSGDLENAIRLIGFVSHVSRLFDVPKLFNNYGHHPLVLPGTKRLSHRPGTCKYQRFDFVLLSAQFWVFIYAHTCRIWPVACDGVTWSFHEPFLINVMFISDSRSMARTARILHLNGLWKMWMYSVLATSLDGCTKRLLSDTWASFGQSLYCGSSLKFNLLICCQILLNAGGMHWYLMFLYAMDLAYGAV